MRKYEVAFLGPNSDGLDFTRLAPAVPAFEAAFAGFARGSLIATPNGQVAVEDLLPGDYVSTVDAGPQKLLWKGATTVLPDVPGQHADMGRLTRVSADALGPGRPMPDLMLGAAARLYEPGVTGPDQYGAAGILTPMRDRIDGVSVIDISPISPVRVFHLGFLSHHRILANGVELGSYHPGPIRDLGLQGDLMGLWLSLFPHITAHADFGAMVAPHVGQVLPV